MGERGKRRRVVVPSEVDKMRQDREDPQAGPVRPRELPDRAAEDRDEAWGDAPDSNDQRLEEDVPPHWGNRGRL